MRDPTKVIEMFKKDNIHVLEEADIRSAPFYRDPNAHKGLYGRTLVIAGSRDIYGACFFCAMAAFKSGAGLVKIVTHENNRYTLQHDLPEAMYAFYGDRHFEDDSKRSVTEKDAENNDKIIAELLKDIGTFDTIVIGPGLTTGDVAHRLVERVTETFDPAKQILVLDADALNILSLDFDLFNRLSGKARGKNVVLTPHEGELSRLAKGAGYPDNDHFCEDFYRKYGIVLVRKGANTRIYGESRYMNTTGNDGMATAGSGDVLAGILGGALHRYALGGETDFAKSVAYCVYHHGYAGNLARDALGSVSMMARDIIQYISI